MTKLSMTARILGTGMLLVPVFVLVVAIAIHQLFSTQEKQFRQDRILTQVYSLLGAIDEADSGSLAFNDERVDPRLSSPEFDLFASVSIGVKVVWRSASWLDDGLTSSSTSSRANGLVYGEYNSDLNARLYCGIQTAEWELASAIVPVAVRVCEPSENLEDKLYEIDLQIIFWLLGAGLTLLVATGIAFVISLKPLNKVAVDLALVQRGELEGLSGDYPRELRQLTHSINALIDNERGNLKRYRAALDDLAHSIKTPLAVVKSSLYSKEQPDQNKNVDIDAQISRIDEIITYQLNRAVMANKQLYLKAVDVAPILDKIVNSVTKVYLNKSIDTELAVDDTVKFQGEPGDLYEIFGNIIENAFKHAVSAIKISINYSPDKSCWQLKVDDDGPGIPLSDVERIFQRGQRGDTKAAGQGLGLALVADITEAISAEIEVGVSRLGGASVTVSFKNNTIM